ncbi:MAG: hypothetical protein [Caudoviricetes sp.]|nr:MAG: hypothetical protein [Caudoviricetes sp.]
MIKVQRYTPAASGYSDAYMVESAAGDWVEYADYDALVEAYAALLERYDLDVNPEGK